MIKEVYILKSLTLKRYKEAYREITRQEERSGFMVHLIVYILVNTMLVILNFVYVPTEIWFFWPLLGWGIGLVLHYIFAIKQIDAELEEKEAKAEYYARNN